MTVLTESGENLEDALRRGELWLVHMAWFGDVASVSACAQALIGSHVRDGAALALDPADGGFILRLTRRMAAGEADIHEPVRTVVQTHGGRYVTAGPGQLDPSAVAGPGRGDVDAALTAILPCDGGKR